MIERENAFIQQVGWLPQAEALQNCRQVLDDISDKLLAMESNRASDSDH